MALSDARIEGGDASSGSRFTFEFKRSTRAINFKFWVDCFCKFVENMLNGASLSLTCSDFMGCKK